jgi:tryptophan synthase alpha chain
MSADAICPVAASGTLIQRCFAQLQQQGRCALMPFLVAGDPDLATTRASLLALQGPAPI